MVTSRQEMQWVLRAQCHDREALEALLRGVQPSSFYHATGVIHNGATTNAMVHAFFALTILWTTLLALVIVIQITVMTKRILRAIELASKK